MYCAADWNGELTKGIETEMTHYQEVGTERALAEARREYISGLTAEDFANNTYSKKVDLSDEEVRVFTKLKSDPNLTVYNLPEEEQAVWQGMVQGGKLSSLNLAVSDMTESFESDFKAPFYTETMTLSPGAKIVTYNEIYNMQQNAGKEYTDRELATYAASKGEGCEAFFRIQTGASQSGDFEKVMKWESEHPDELAAAESFRLQTAQKAEEVRVEAVSMNLGAYAVLRGYDAIDAQDHGQSGSYTVILNRTKTIILDGSGRSDSEDDGVISFQDGGDGLVYAIRNGKIIGWVKASDGTDG